MDRTNLFWTDKNRIYRNPMRNKAFSYRWLRRTMSVRVISSWKKCWKRNSVSTPSSENFSARSHSTRLQWNIKCTWNIKEHTQTNSLITFLRYLNSFQIIRASTISLEVYLKIIIQSPLRSLIRWHSIAKAWISILQTRQNQTKIKIPFKLANVLLKRYFQFLH